MVWGHHQHLRNGQGRFGHLKKLVKSGRIGHKFVVHVDEEVVPVGVEWDVRRALDVKLQNGLQVTVEVSESHLLRVHSVHLKSLRYRGFLTIAVKLDFPLGALGDGKALEDGVGLLGLDVAGEAGHEFAQGSELLLLLTHQLDESVPVRDQT